MRLYTCLSVLAVLLVFPACSRNEPPIETRESDAPVVDRMSQSGTTIDLIVNEHPWVEFITPKLDEFHALTGITVTLHVFPEDQFRTKRTVEFVSGVSDIDAFMIMPGNSLSHYAARGWAEPLDRFLEDREDHSALLPDFDGDDFYPAALTAGRRDGAYLVIPLLLETSMIAYNRQVLERFNLAPPRTMEDLEYVARTVYEGTSGEIYGISMRGNAAAATSQWSGFLYSFGGAWTDAAGNAALDSPQAIAALDFYGRLVRRYGPRDVTRNNWYESVSLFAEGRAAMIYDANVFRPDFPYEL